MSFTKSFPKNKPVLPKFKLAALPLTPGNNGKISPLNVTAGRFQPFGPELIVVPNKGEIFPVVPGGFDTTTLP